MTTKKKEYATKEDLKVVVDLAERLAKHHVDYLKIDVEYLKRMDELREKALTRIFILIIAMAFGVLLMCLTM